MRTFSHFGYGSQLPRAAEQPFNPRAEVEAFCNLVRRENEREEAEKAN